MNILTARDFTPDFVHAVFEKADRYANPGLRLPAPKGMGLLFWDAPAALQSRVSYEVAMKSLGGWVVSDTEMTAESTLWAAHAMKSVVDLLVIRSTPGHAAELGRGIVPVINAGDRQEEPVEALAVLYAVWRKFRRADGLRLLFVGNLRTPVVQSLALAASNLPGTTLLLAPRGHNNHLNPMQQNLFADVSRRCRAQVFVDVPDAIRAEPDVVFQSGFHESGEVVNNLALLNKSAIVLGTPDVITEDEARPWLKGQVQYSTLVKKALIDMLLAE